MGSRILQVFYGYDRLPYKDKDRSIHYPIVGNTFIGSNNVDKLRFYVRDIGGTNNITWVLNAKLPNGNILYQVLSTIGLDEELNEYYVEFSVSQFYTQLKGDVYFALNGCDGEVKIETDDETNIQTITARVESQTILVTGAIKFSNNYAPQRPLGFSFDLDQYQNIINALADKTNIANSIQVLADIANEDLSGYDNGQVFYDIYSKHFYKKTDNGYENYDIVPFNQANVSIIIDTLTNINGQQFVNFTSAKEKIGTYDVYHIKYENNNTTEEQAREYMAYMTGSNYLPKYNYDRPANSYLLMTDGTILKPQYDSSNGLLLYVMSQVADTNYLRKNYVPSVEITSILTAQEVYDLVGSNRLFGYSVDDYMYIAMFVDDNNNQKHLVVYGETGSFETESFTLSELFREVISNENLRISSFPTVSLTQPNEYLLPKKMSILNQSNSCIEYNGRTYFKAYDNGTYIEFVCTNYDKLEETYITITKYTVVVNKQTGRTTVLSELFNTYNKSQIDSQLQVIRNSIENININSGSAIDLSIDSNYDLVVKLLNDNGDVISQSDVDLPLESIVVSATYYDTYTYDGTTYNQVLVIVLATTPTPTIIPVGQLVSGLEKEAFIQVDNIGTNLTNEQLAIANLPNARIKYGNNYFVKANGNGVNIVFANLLLGITESNGVFTLEKQTLTVQKSSGEMNTTTTYATFYSKAQIDALLSSKANASDVYTKIESIDLFPRWTNTSQYNSGGTIVRRKNDGKVEIRVPLTPIYGDEPASRQYVDAFGKSLTTSLDSSTYVITFGLKDANNNTLSTQTIDLPLESIVNMVAPNYNEASTYVVGDVITYGNRLYQCTTAVNIPEDFDSSKWSEGSVVSLILGLINTGI